MDRYLDGRILIGWREWCALPELHMPAIKAKIDTGARTSALHASQIRRFSEEGKSYVSFCVFPIQGNNKIVVCCESPIVDERYVTSSNGHRELRFIILTQLKLGPLTWEIELSLSNRDPLKFRMLLGREAFKSLVMIDPSRSLYLGRNKKREILKIYGYNQS